MKASVLNEGGKSVTMEMGCYGIGFRLVAAAIEQNNDQYGIIWPDAIAPFEVAIVPMNMHKSERVAEQAQQFYAELKAAGVDVLFDDRKERPGVMFADMELIGVPHAIVIGDRGLTTAWWSTSAAARREAGSGDRRDRCHAQGQTGSLITRHRLSFSRSPECHGTRGFYMALSHDAQKCVSSVNQ